MSVPADPTPSALARWWWRTPVWSRLLTSLGGGFTVLMILTGLFAPPASQQPQPGAHPVVAITSTSATTATTSTTPSSTTPTTTTTESSTTTTEPPPTTTEAPVAAPPATQQPAPTTYEPAPQPPTEAPAPPPSDGGTVRSGEFCSTDGAFAHTSTGKLMVCKRTATDPRLRWRAA